MSRVLLIVLITVICIVIIGGCGTRTSAPDPTPKDMLSEESRNYAHAMMDHTNRFAANLSIVEADLPKREELGYQLWKEDVILYIELTKASIKEGYDLQPPHGYEDIQNQYEQVLGQCTQALDTIIKAVETDNASLVGKGQRQLQEATAALSKVDEEFNSILRYEKTTGKVPVNPTQPATSQ